ncbi:hypothetical protein ACFPES_11950 [Paenibacillus sp. GCM10023248]|uniref:hypothetical protein n=1 Tax=Bacillales TaxID=1385 RepID=UPI0023792A30|nr:MULTISPECIES: hypothetical protein [Bacillales]MDD9267739.1 hypothetical protein [Paenibacillus sp. MAHUQ-63]MDR6882199.1 hypothetical protein [Bacillus sp. 3255]
MNEGLLVKWFGVICILAGVFRMGMTPASLIWGTDSTQELTTGLIACVLMSVGSIVLYMVQSRETGVIGMITILAIIVGNILTTAMLWSQFAAGGANAVQPEGLLVNITRMFGMIGFMGGTLVFMVVTYMAKVFPRWIPALILLMILSMFLPIEDNKYFAFFWGLTYVGMGYCIMAKKLRHSKTLSSNSYSA